VKKVLYIILIVSLVLNIALIYKYTENAKILNLTWSNSFRILDSTIQASTFNLKPVDSPYETALNDTRTGLNQLTNRLINLKTLPQGNQIVSPEIISKVSEVTNYEYKLLDKIENDLKKSNTISNTDIEELDKLNKAWIKMSDTLQEEVKKINELSPIFRVKQWTMVLDKATNGLNGLELLPLSE